MTDIVKRLRSDINYDCKEEAADEIERLRDVLKDIASMRAHELYYADGQEHDNAAAACAAQALKPS